MAIGCLRIGLDDTDAPGGLCTTWLGAVLACRLEAAGVPVRERRLVRLNPNAPFRTRGNAAIALLAEGDPALAFELACAAVEEFAPLDAPMTNPGVVVADRPLPGDVLPPRRDRPLHGRRYRRGSRRGRCAIPGVRQRARPDRGRGGGRGRVSRPDLRAPRVPRAGEVGDPARGGRGLALPGRGRDLPPDLGLGGPRERRGRLRPPHSRPGPLRDPRREPGLGSRGPARSSTPSRLRSRPAGRRTRGPTPTSSRDGAERSGRGGRTRSRARSRTGRRRGRAGT